MQVNVLDANSIENYTLVACCDRQEVETVKVFLDNSSGGRTSIRPPNMYMLRRSTLEANVLVPADELGSKAGFLIENRIRYFFEHDGRVHNM